MDSSLQSVSIEQRLAELSDEFADRIRNGEQPGIEEYVDRHPEMEQIIRRVLPAVEVMCGLTTDHGSRPVTSLTNELDELGALGDFRIIREIGRGGMAVVYEAEQISLARRVALKVLPFAAVLDPKQLQRFKNEAQAAGSLDHPNIVHVYSVGCERGVHYYAMQYIDGQTLDAILFQVQDRDGSKAQEPHAESADAEDSLAAREQANRDTHPIAGLSTKGSKRDEAYFQSIAKLGIQAAEAMHYAHQMGIVHRDIKPSNMLVDATDHLWVTDFGLAMTQSEGNLTRTGDLLGT